MKLVKLGDYYINVSKICYVIDDRGYDYNEGTLITQTRIGLGMFAIHVNIPVNKVLEVIENEL